MNTNEYTPPFTSVGEANEHAAFLTSVDGHDVATVFRRTHPIQSHHSHLQDALLTDAEWQDTINLIDAAPKLLEALVDLLGGVGHTNGLCHHCGRDNRGYENEPCSDDCLGEKARAAINLVTKGKP